MTDPRTAAGPDLTAPAPLVPGPAGVPPTPAKKTAIVVVHGMGEQRPMETLWGLVSALWTEDDAILGAPPKQFDAKAIWSKPESITGSYELRRITTDFAILEHGKPKRLDFFEFYWANLMTGNTIKSVWGWLFGLLFRLPSSVPRPLLGFWVLGVMLYSISALLLALAAIHNTTFSPLAHLPNNEVIYAVAAVFAFVLGAIGTGWVAPVAGDAARYLSAKPDNVDARQKIREAGVNLLTKLHASAHYDRIIVLAHSLGAVIAYDVLNACFGRLSEEELKRAHAQGTPALTELAALEVAAGELVAAPADRTKLSAYRNAQRAYQEALRHTPDPPVWLISDFVTVGSPLSKANVLLAKDADDLKLKKARREAPTCPPWLESNEPKADFFRFSYPPGKRDRIPHHGAAFAPVVWTNIYYPSSWAVVLGDIVAGPCADQLGPGIRDIHLPMGSLGFKHLAYWSNPQAQPPSPALVQLRKAVNLCLRDEDALWGRPPPAPATAAPAATVVSGRA